MVRDQEILGHGDAGPVRPGDYVYLLAPPEKAQALDRFFVAMPPPPLPDPRLLGDFFVTGEHALGELAEIYGLKSRLKKTPQHWRTILRPNSGTSRSRARYCISGRLYWLRIRSWTDASRRSACACRKRMSRG